MTNRTKLNIALIGNGTIAAAVSRHCNHSAGRISVCAALGLPEDEVSTGPHPIVQDLHTLLALKPDLVVECAAQDAVKAHGVSILRAGIDLMVISVGVFAIPGVASQLEDAATKGGTRVIVPAGALAGLDALSAAASEQLDEVTLTTRKPPHAWACAPGVAEVDLESITEATTIFSGTAREAAQNFPKNANVAAALALAGIGMDKTMVTLIADPFANRNSHCVMASGAFGRLSTMIEAEPAPENPKTSYLAALSITRMLERLIAPIVI
ncbi:MAG: aspartate dehydrogenase [Rhodospirillaceae bacterium]